MLCQPQGQQSPDEDGAGVGAGGPCQLPSWGARARRCAQAHQRARSGPNHGVRHL